MQTECRPVLQAAARRMLVSLASCAVGIIPYHGGYGSQNSKFLAATTMQTECRAMFQAAARRMLVSMASCAVGIIPYHGGYGSQSQHKTTERDSVSVSLCLIFLNKIHT